MVGVVEFFDSTGIHGRITLHSNPWRLIEVNKRLDGNQTVRFS